MDSIEKNQNSNFQELSLAKLHQIRLEYPWFHGAQFLFLKKLFDTDKSEYKKYLSEIAIGVPDRGVLWHYIHSEIETEEPLKDKNLLETKVTDNVLKVEETTTQVEAVDTTFTEEQPASVSIDEKKTPDKELETKPIVESCEEGYDPKRSVLIEKFIQSEPKIIPKEGGFESAIELAEKSNIPVFDLVTETLANVYLQQGNKSNAILILKKLSLSMPEKSSYFAARIKEIKKS